MSTFLWRQSLIIFSLLYVVFGVNVYVIDSFESNRFLEGDGCLNTTSNVEEVLLRGNTFCAQIYQYRGCTGRTMQIRYRDVSNKLEDYIRRTAYDGNVYNWKWSVGSVSDCVNIAGATNSAMLCQHFGSGCTQIPYLNRDECINLGWLEKRISRIDLDAGCLIVYDKKSCEGNSATIRRSYSTMRDITHPIFPYNWNDETSSISSCAYSEHNHDEHYYNRH